MTTINAQSCLVALWNVQFTSFKFYRSEKNCLCVRCINGAPKQQNKQQKIVFHFTITEKKILIRYRLRYKSQCPMCRSIKTGIKDRFRFEISDIFEWTQTEAHFAFADRRKLRENNNLWNLLHNWNSLLEFRQPKSIEYMNSCQFYPSENSERSTLSTSSFKHLTAKSYDFFFLAEHFKSWLFGQIGVKTKASTSFLIVWDAFPLQFWVEVSYSEFWPSFKTIFLQQNTTTVFGAFAFSRFIHARRIENLEPDQ